MPNIALQRFLTAILAAGLSFVATSIEAQNKYDVLARVLQPYGALFYSKATTKAMQADVILREGPPTATEILNQPLRIFLQIPDKLRIETLDPQHRVVFCRNGQKVWVYPHGILAGIVAPRQQLDRERRIPDFRLPLKDQQIIWIPALFQILRFVSAPDAAGTPIWAIDFQLVPEFAQALKCDAWTASAIVTQSDFQLRHLRIASSRWTGAIDIIACRFEKAHPPQTWEPDSDLANEATLVPPELFESALESIAAIAIPR
jgi:outer membrane lipoprotein-sorting protein